MPDNYEHYITRNIKAFYKRRLFSPIIYLLLLAILWLVFPLGDMLRPHMLKADETLQNSYQDKNRYVRTTFYDLRFTGYTSESHGQTRGYFYYTIRDKQCEIVLLSPNTCEEGLPTIDSLRVTGRIVQGQETYQTLLSNLSDDLDWTSDGINSQLNAYYFSEPAYHRYVTTFLFIVYFGTMIYSAYIRASVPDACRGRRRTCHSATACNGGHVYHRALFYYDIALRQCHHSDS